MLTLSLAAKTVCIVLAAQSPKPSGIDKSIALLGDSLRPNGVAVLIDNRGYFITASQISSSKTIEATLSDGTKLFLTFVSSDEISELTLMLAQDWKTEFGTPARVMKWQGTGTQPLTLVNSNSRIKGELTAGNRVGILADTGRYVPLNEMRFESQQRAMGGAPVFNEKGELAGFINASVGNVSNQNLVKIKADQKLGARNYGPQGLVVSYSFSDKVIGRVVDGFLSEGNQPKHPYLGVFYQNHINGGIEVKTVTKGSPSDTAGFKVGDLILQMNQTKVSDSFVFAAKIFETFVGEVVEFDVKRNGVPMNFSVTIGQIPNSKGVHMTPNIQQIERNNRFSSTDRNRKDKMLSLTALVQAKQVDDPK